MMIKSATKKITHAIVNQSELSLSLVFSDILQIKRQRRSNARKSISINAPLRIHRSLFRQKVLTENTRLDEFPINYYLNKQC